MSGGFAGWSAKLLRLLRSPGTVAVVAQVWQALGSFALQVLAARLLGVDGLAVVSLCYGTIILATAVGSGIVGDSLTVPEAATAKANVVVSSQATRPARTTGSQRSSAACRTRSSRNSRVITSRTRVRSPRRTCSRRIPTSTSSWA